MSFQMPANAGRDETAVMIRADWERQRERNNGAPKGEQAPRARLTATQVYEIRRRYDAVDETCAEIAADYDISATHVSSIGRGIVWGHLPEAMVA